MGAHDPLDAHARTSAPEAEQSILGALLLDNGALEEIAGVVSEVDFTIGEHALVFKAIRELIQRGARRCRHGIRAVAFRRCEG